MSKYAVSRFINGICLNPKEFLLEGEDPDGDVKLFDSEDEAKEFLSTQGMTLEEINDSIDEGYLFIEPYEEQEVE